MDLYKSDERLQKAIERINNSTEISERNKQDILGFEHYCYTVERLSASRVLNYVIRLGKLVKLVNKNFVDFDKNDVIALVERAEREGYYSDKEKKVWHEYSPKTKVMLRVCLKKFYRWLRNVEPPEYPA